MHDQTIFRQALLFAYRNLDRPVAIDDLCAAASTDTRGLNNAFAAVADTTPMKLVRRLKMENGYRTLQDRETSILATALAVGFEDHSAFSRSFKRAFGYPPSEGRGKTLLQRELEHVELEQPEFVELDALSIQCVTVEGYYHDCAARAWSELSAVAKGGSDSRVWIGMALDDPHPGVIPSDKVRFVAGVEGMAKDLGIESRSLPGGIHARFRFAGKTANLGLAYHYIYGPWRDASGLTLSASPALLMFDEMPNDNGNSSTTLICVPLAASL